jgi:hypothetical protein
MENVSGVPSFHNLILMRFNAPGAAANNGECYQSTFSSR